MNFSEDTVRNNREKMEINAKLADIYNRGKILAGKFKEKISEIAGVKKEEILEVKAEKEEKDEKKSKCGCKK